MKHAELTLASLPLQMQRLLQAATSPQMLDAQIIKEARDLWESHAPAMQGNPQRIIQTFDACCNRAQSPTRRRLNSLVAMAGQAPEVELAYISTDHEVLSPFLQETGAAVLAEANRQRKRAATAESVSALRLHLRAIEKLVTCQAIQAHAVRLLLVDKLAERTSTATQAAQELRQLEEADGCIEIDEHPSFSVAEKGAAWRIVGNMHRIAQAVLHDPNWQGWARQKMLTAAELLRLKGPATPSAVRQATEQGIRSVEAALGMSTLRTTDPTGTGQVLWKRDFEERLLALPEDCSLRKRCLTALYKARADAAEGQAESKAMVDWLEKAFSCSQRVPEPTEHCTEARNAFRQRAYQGFTKLIGQDDIKDEIIDSLGAALASGGLAGSQWLFVGQSGIGKTSAAKIVAEISSRPLHIIQANQLDQKSELVGGQKMYVNTEPGGLAQALLKHDKPPVILIDEVGKSSAGARQTLNSILSKDSNKAFVDTYLGPDVPLDFSQCIIILTSNLGEKLEKSMIERAREVVFNSIKPDEREQILDLMWAREKNRLGLQGFALKEPARRQLLENSAHLPGVRVLDQDVSALASKILTLSDRGDRAFALSASFVRRVIQKTAAHSVEETTHGARFQVVFGNLASQLPSLKRTVIFKGWQRTWRAEVNAEGFCIEKLDGPPFTGYHGFSAYNRSARPVARLITRYRQSYENHGIVLYWKHCNPPLGELDVEAFGEKLLHDDGTLHVRFAVGLKRDFVADRLPEVVSS